jgi:hypothetical protein
MKLSHISAEVDKQLVLTHFLHLKDRIININMIFSIQFEPTMRILTMDGFQYIVTDKEDIQDLKQFFQRS